MEGGGVRREMRGGMTDSVEVLVEEELEQRRRQGLSNLRTQRMAATNRSKESLR